MKQSAVFATAAMWALVSAGAALTGLASGAALGRLGDARADRIRVTQVYSPYCQTANGVCVVSPPMPVGSPCDCGGVGGVIVQ